MNTTDSEYIELLKRCLTAELYEESAWELVGRRTKNPLKRKVYTELAKRSWHLVRAKPFDPESRQQGLDGPLFGFTMIGHRRLDNLQHCVETVLKDGIPGDFIETGVWRGGAVILMRALLKVHQVTDRRVWAADSFEGMPKPDVATHGEKAQGLDLSHVDYFKVTVDDVRHNLDRFGLLDDQVGFLKGWFKDTLPQAPIARLAVLRLDGDLYESTMDALNPLYPKVSRGGFVIVDDYNSWPACKHAITDYRATHQITSELIPIDPHAVYWRVE